MKISMLFFSLLFFGSTLFSSDSDKQKVYQIPNSNLIHLAKQIPAYKKTLNGSEIVGYLLSEVNKKDEAESGITVSGDVEGSSGAKQAEPAKDPIAEKNSNERSCGGCVIS